MKQKAKRLSAFILTAAIILSLTACSGDNTSVSEGNISSGISENNTSSDTSKPQNNTAVENTGNKVDDTLPQCEPANCYYGSIMKGESGYYYNDVITKQIDIVNYYYSAICYYDTVTSKSIPLCAKPQCMHDGNDFCVATGGMSNFNSNYLYNGYIYRLGTEQTDNDNTIKMLRADLLGNELSKVADVYKEPIVDEYRLSSLSGNAVFHYGKAFLTLRVFTESGFENKMFMVDLETGESKQISVPSPENQATRIKSDCFLTLLADGDWLYYTTREAKWNHPIIRDNAHMTYDKTSLYRYNIKTGETELISAMPDIYSSFAVNEDIIYYTVTDRKNNTFSFYSYDIASNKTSTFAENVQMDYIEGKYVSDRKKVTVLTDRSYLYICTQGNSGGTHVKERTENVDFYIYDLEGNLLAHGFKGMESLLDKGKEWNYHFYALNGEIYLYYEGDRKSNDSGIYTIKTEDLINGSTEWTKLYNPGR